MKFLLIGSLLSVIGTAISILLWGLEKAYFLAGVIGIVFLGTSMILSGAMVDGAQTRANFATESDEDRNKRFTTTTHSLLIGLPNIIIAVLLYLYI